MRGQQLYLTTAIDARELEPGEVARAEPGPPQADGVHRFVVLALPIGVYLQQTRLQYAPERPYPPAYLASLL